MPTAGLPIPTFSPESPTTMLSPIGEGLWASSRLGYRAGRWAGRWAGRMPFAAVSRRTNARSRSPTGSRRRPLDRARGLRFIERSGRSRTGACSATAGAGPARTGLISPRAGFRREIQERARRPLTRPERRQQRRTSPTPALRSDWKRRPRDYTGDRLKVGRRRKARCQSVRRLRQRAVNAVLADALRHRGAERSRVGRIGEEINAAEAL
jgi:hypothetical protein